MKNSLLLLISVIASICGFAQPYFAAQNTALTYITFDAPGAGTFPGSITEVNGIDSAGDVAGRYTDFTCAFHAFVRTASGVFSTIDGPEATATYCTGMNASGVAIGAYSDRAGRSHGFIRDLNGVFTIIDVPGSTETVPQAINSAGEITGDSGFFSFLRSPEGTLRIFAALGASAGTNATAINTAGSIAGDYETHEEVIGAFVRSADGTIGTTFEAPNAIPKKGTYATAIASDGSVFGYYYRVDGESEQYAGFKRTPNGEYIDLVEPETAAPLTPTAINVGGTLTGTYSSAPAVLSGFLLNSQNVFTRFSVPTAESTTPTCINQGGEVAGYYLDSTGEFPHGFIRIP